MQDVRTLSLHVLIQFGVDRSNHLEVMIHIGKQRWMMVAILLAAILDFVRNKIWHAGCEVCESTGPYKIWC
jgi:hypothetical protein